MSDEARFALYALYMLNTEDAEPGRKAKLFWKTLLIDIRERVNPEMEMLITGTFNCQDNIPAILDSDIIRIIHKIFKERTELQNAMKHISYIWSRDLTKQLPYISVDAIIRNAKENLYHTIDNYYDSSGRYYQSAGSGFYKLMKYMPYLSLNEELKNGLMIFINAEEEGETKPDKETEVKPFVNFLFGSHEFKLNKLSGLSQHKPPYSNRISFELCLHGKLSNGTSKICPYFYIDFSISHEFHKKFLHLLRYEDQFAEWFKKSLKEYKVTLTRDLYFKVMKFKLSVELTRSYVERGLCRYALHIRIYVDVDKKLSSAGKQFQDLLERLETPWDL